MKEKKKMSLLLKLVIAIVLGIVVMAFVTLGGQQLDARRAVDHGRVRGGQGVIHKVLQPGAVQQLPELRDPSDHHWLRRPRYC